MRFVPTKTAEQQSGLVLHRTRHLLIGQQTLVINAIRAHLAEFGIIAPVGRQPQISQCALEQANKISARRWHVPKLELVTVLSGLLATNRIRLAHNLPNLEVLRRETQTFLHIYGASGRSTFSAASGKHDDTISAFSLACWWASMPYNPAWSHRRGGDFAVVPVVGMF